MLLHRHVRSVTIFAALLVLALGASACGGSDTTSTVDQSPVTGQTPASAGQVDSQETSSDDQQPGESDEVRSPEADGSYGPKPAVQSFQIQPEALTKTGTPVGVGYTFTEIDSPESGLIYLAVGDASGVHAVLLDEGIGQLMLCGNSADGCGDGTAEQGPFAALATFDTWHPTMAFGRLRTPTPAEIGPLGGWEPVDENYTNDGYPGRCYRSTGQDDTGQPTQYPAGDVLCTVFYEFASEFVVSYDYGGDGVYEIETTRLGDSFGSEDLELPPAAAGADQVGLNLILDNMANSGESYDLLG